jgi:hypothetical protein
MSYLWVHSGCGHLPVDRGRHMLLHTLMLHHDRDHPPFAPVCVFIRQLLICFKAGTLLSAPSPPGPDLLLPPRQSASILACSNVLLLIPEDE